MKSSGLPSIKRRVHFDSPLFSSRKLSTPTSPLSSLTSPFGFGENGRNELSPMDFMEGFDPKRSISLDSIYLHSNKASLLNFPSCSEDLPSSIAARFFSAVVRMPWITSKSSFTEETETDDDDDDSTPPLLSYDSAHSSGGGGSPRIIQAPNNSTSSFSSTYLNSSPSRQQKISKRNKNISQANRKLLLNADTSKDSISNIGGVINSSFIDIHDQYSSIFRKKKKKKRVQRLANTLIDLLIKSSTSSNASARKKQFKEPKRLPNSRTFPMSRHDAQQFSSITMKSTEEPPEEEFNEDFVPYSYAAKNVKEENPTVNAKIRRMSLKEFSGLEAELAKTPVNPLAVHGELNAHAGHGNYPSVSPNFRRPSSATATMPLNFNSPLVLPKFNTDFGMGSLIEKFSSRRRSSSGLTKQAHQLHAVQIPSLQQQDRTASGENLYDSFEKVIDAIDSAIQETYEPSTTNTNIVKNIESIEEHLKSLELLDRQQTDQEQQSRNATSEQPFKNIYKRLILHSLLICSRLDGIRERLNATMQSVPNASPKKFENTKNEKLEMLSETRYFVAQMSSLAVGTQEMQPIIQKTIDSVDRVTRMAELLIQKSTSLFQAQLMTAKMDQMLKALEITLEDVERAFGAPKYGDEAKQLFRSSTTLAATLNQLIFAVKQF